MVVVVVVVLLLLVVVVVVLVVDHWWWRGLRRWWWYRQWCGSVCIQVFFGADSGATRHTMSLAESRPSASCAQLAFARTREFVRTLLCAPWRARWITRGRAPCFSILCTK